MGEIYFDWKIDQIFKVLLTAFIALYFLLECMLWIRVLEERNLKNIFER